MSGAENRGPTDVARGLFDGWAVRGEAGRTAGVSKAEARELPVIDSEWAKCLVGGRAQQRGEDGDISEISVNGNGTLEISREARMHKRVVMTVWIAALIAGWLFWTDPGPAAAAPKVYVGLFKDDAVAVVDTAQNKVVGTIPVPKGPHGLVITPDGRKVYVSSDGASTVSVIDTGSDRVIATIEVGANPHGLAVSGDGRRVLTLGWGTNRVLVIDTATDRVIAEVPVAQPHNGTLSRDGSIAWVGVAAAGRHRAGPAGPDGRQGDRARRARQDAARPRAEPRRHARVLHAGRRRLDPGARHHRATRSSRRSRWERLLTTRPSPPTAAGPSRSSRGRASWRSWTRRPTRWPRRCRWARPRTGARPAPTAAPPT